MPIKVVFETGSSNFKGVLASAPLFPQEDWFYINSIDNGYYVYYGGTWQLLHTLTPAAHDYWVLEDGTFVVFDEAGGSKVIVH
jgi:hypothetical protein